MSRAARMEEMQEGEFDVMKAATEAALKADREAALRDVFACSAMGAMITKHGDVPFITKVAYEYADAMLKARKEKAA